MDYLASTWLRSALHDTTLNVVLHIMNCVCLSMDDLRKIASLHILEHTVSFNYDVYVSID